jgi:ubiquinone/menaquinone biosynthesis C-methylase UbiE
MALEVQFLNQLLFAFVKSGLLRAALDLELFTHIAHGRRTAAEIAVAADADPRAVTIVLDALTAQGLLHKTTPHPGADGPAPSMHDGDHYALDPLVAALLVKDSPTYAGAFTRITLNPRLWHAVGKLSEIVRTGRVPESMADVPEHEFWVEFSEASEGISQLAANAVADRLVLDPARPAEVLDVAAGSGVYGFTALERFPRARLTSLDWPNVLAHARTIAERRGVAERVTWLGGSAFEAALPAAHFDAIIMSHFFHHFSLQENTALARRLFAALKPGGQLIVQEFVPDDARTAHEPALMFAVIMLATTTRGNAYTFAEYRQVLEDAGFSDLSLTPVEMSGSALVTARRPHSA